MLSKETNEILSNAAIEYASKEMRQTDLGKKWYEDENYRLMAAILRDAFKAGAEWALTSTTDQPCTHCKVCGDHPEKCEVFPDCGDCLGNMDVKTE